MPDIDGTLAAWADIEELHDWGSLLIGNGLSINVWPRFAYGSLFEQAFTRGLTAQDQALFDGTSNFERVLGDLGTTIRVARVEGIDESAFLARYQRIQDALGHAVRAVHLRRSDVDDGALSAIRDVLEEFEWIFTTSYDLILYWAMGASWNERFEPFMDHFRWDRRCAFDPKRSGVYVNQIPVYFLHGALHLVVGGDGVTWKLRRTAIDTLLDQFGRPIAGDDAARPLLVTEGSSREKLRAIEANDYLSHSLEVFQNVDLPTVVFGSSLGPEDQHLLDALNEHPDRPVAVSMMPGSKRELMRLQADIYGRLEATTLLFFDATTHPLGDPALRPSV